MDLVMTFGKTSPPFSNSFCAGLGGYDGDGPLGAGGGLLLVEDKPAVKLELECFPLEHKLVLEMVP